LITGLIESIGSSTPSSRSRDGITGLVPVLPYVSFTPSVGPNVFLAPDAVLVGKVRVTGPGRFDASAVARGDQNWIDIGARFRMGTGSSIHVEFHTQTSIGSDVWVGDGCVVHATTLGDNVRVEDGALVLSTSRVGDGSIVAAGSLVTEGAEFEPNSYISGTPGRRVRETTEEERAQTRSMVGEALQSG
jgi:carbonic anhydrase/acetyltransferase-like protein (isoleucine patch superfamily)